MDQVIVSLEAQDHKIGEDETTLCGIVVPMGTYRIDGTDPCPVCFEVEKPKAKGKKAKAADGDAA